LKDNDPDFLLADRDVAIKQISLAARRQKFFRVVKRGDKIVAALLADFSGNHHSKLKLLSQQYFACSETGTAAYKCIKLLHEALIAFGEENECHVVMSQGSPQDPDNVFARILEKQGWQRKHFLAIWKTTQYPRALA
jgi:hypothetical protein